MQHDLNELAGTLVRLRAPEPGDLDTFRSFDLESDGARRWGSTNLPISRAQQERWTQEDAAKRPTDDKTHLAIATITDDAVVGSMSVGNADRRHGVFTYGIGVGRDHRRKGYGTEAIPLLLRFYFHELRYQKCDTYVYAFNTESLEFHQRLGFVVEGRRRQCVYTRGEYHDAFLIGMTRDEFEERYGT